jgi:hypothetical protein
MSQKSRSLMSRSGLRRDPRSSWGRVLGEEVAGLDEPTPLQLASESYMWNLSGALFHKPLCTLSPTLEPAGDCSCQTYSAPGLDAIVNSKVETSCG